MVNFANDCKSVVISSRTNETVGFEVVKSTKAGRNAEAHNVVSIGRTHFPTMELSKIFRTRRSGDSIACRKVEGVLSFSLSVSFSYNFFSFSMAAFWELNLNSSVERNAAPAACKLLS